MLPAIVNVRNIHTGKFAYRGFSNLAAKRLNMLEDGMLNVLLERGVLLTQEYVITLAPASA